MNQCQLMKTPYYIIPTEAFTQRRFFVLGMVSYPHDYPHGTFGVEKKVLDIYVKIVPYRSNKKGKVGGLNTTYEIMHLAGLKPKRGGNRAGSLSQARLASDTQCKKKANVLLRNWEYTFDIESALTAQSKCNEKGASRKRKGARGISTEEPLPSTSAISGREVATDMDSHAGEDTVPFAKISKTSEMLSTTACNIDPCVKLEIEEKMKLESEDENCDSMEVAMEISTAVKQETPATNIVPRARVVIETANMDPDPPWPFEVELPVTPLPFCQDLSFWDGTEWASTGLIPSLTTSQMWLAQHQ